MSDTRRPRLTLRHLHKLRKMRDMQTMDNDQHLVFVRKMYGTPDEESGQGPI